MQENLFSRAGGGEDFGSGGFDSFDSDWGSSDWDTGSSYTSGSSNVDPGVGSCVCFLMIIIFIVLVIINSIIKRRGGKGLFPANTGATTGSATKSSSPNVSNRSMTKEEIDTSLAKLKEIDPQFELQKFKTHAKKVFMATQEGWTKRDQAVCRAFMAEEVYQSHQMQIDNMKQNKIINILERIVVGSVDFARIDLDSDYHKITVKLRASMTDYKIKEDDPKTVIAGNKTQQPPFTEFWTFIRKSNLKSKVKDGIFDRKCPNCGAPISVDVAGKCKYCNANVVNGDYDWVLSEIIQKEEWQE